MIKNKQPNKCDAHNRVGCNTCASRKKRAKNPMRYAYDALKHNVIRRKGRAFFYLTFDEFKQFAYETNYLVGKGITKKGWGIDCKDQTMGYFIGNIRPLENSLNSKKGNKTLLYEYDPHERKMVATFVDLNKIAIQKDWNNIGGGVKRLFNYTILNAYPSLNIS